MRKLSRTLGQEKVAGYVFILPFIIGLIVFTVIPFFTSLYLAFTEYDILTPPKWIGLDNFKRMFFEDKYFWKSFWVTFKFALIQVPIKLLVSLGVALILSRKTKAIPLYRAAFYIPSLMGGSVAVALTWKQLFSYDGAINHITALFGMEPVKWLSNPGYGPGGADRPGRVAVRQLHAHLPGGAEKRPRKLPRGGHCGRRGPVKRFFKIVLPMITPIFFFNLINQTIGAFQAFNSSYLITQGKPLNTTLYYGVHLYNRAFTYYEMGYGSAMAWFMLLVIAAFTALIFRSSTAWVYYESEGK